MDMENIIRRKTNISFTLDNVDVCSISMKVIIIIITTMLFIFIIISHTLEENEETKD